MGAMPSPVMLSGENGFSGKRGMADRRGRGEGGGVISGCFDYSQNGPKRMREAGAWMGAMPSPVMLSGENGFSGRAGDGGQEREG